MMLLINRYGRTVGNGLSGIPLEIPEGMRLSYRDVISYPCPGRVRLEATGGTAWLEPTGSFTMLNVIGDDIAVVTKLINMFNEMLGQVNISPQPLPGLPTLATKWERFKFIWEYVMKGRTT